MRDFLQTLVSLSLAGSVLALLTAGCLRLLRGRLSQAFCYYIWLLVLVRLVLPVGLPFGLIGRALPQPETSAAAPAADTDAAASLTDDAAEPIFPTVPITPESSGAVSGTQQVLPLDGTADIPAAQPETPPSAADDIPVQNGFSLPHFTIAQLLFALWLAGALLCFCWHLAAYRRYRRQLRAEELPADLQDEALFHTLCGRHPPRLACSSAAKTPLVAGLLRPTVYLPPRAYVQSGRADALAWTLRHELTHCRRHDLAYKWLVLAVTSVHWFNPVMLLIRRAVDQSCELSCDEAVLRNATPDQRRAYGDTLLQTAARRAVPAGAVATTLGENAAQLKERLLHIKTPRTSSRRAAALMLALALVLTGCGALLSPARQAAETGGTSLSTSMPAPFADGTDEPYAFRHVLPAELEAISPVWIEQVGENAYKAWQAERADTTLGDHATTTLDAACNAYSFLRYFALSEELTISALTQDNGLSENEAAAYASCGPAEVLNAFALPQTIVHGDQFYTPQWVYWNTADAYRAAGLTAEELLARAEDYAAMGLSAQAAAALSEKLTAYTGTEVLLSAPEESTDVLPLNPDPLLPDYDLQGITDISFPAQVDTAYTWGAYTGLAGPWPVDDAADCLTLYQALYAVRYTRSWLVYLPNGTDSSVYSLYETYAGAEPVLCGFFGDGTLKQDDGYDLFEPFAVDYDLAPADAPLRPAWRITLQDLEGEAQSTWDVYVDALTGDLYAGAQTDNYSPSPYLARSAYGQAEYARINGRHSVSPKPPQTDANWQTVPGAAAVSYRFSAAYAPLEAALDYTVPSTTVPALYNVQTGDTWASIAALFGMNADELYRYNPDVPYDPADLNQHPDVYALVIWPH